MTQALTPDRQELVLSATAYARWFLKRRPYYRRVLGPDALAVACLALVRAAITYIPGPKPFAFYAEARLHSMLDRAMAKELRHGHEPLVMESYGAENGTANEPECVHEYALPRRSGGGLDWQFVGVDPAVLTSRQRNLLTLHYGQNWTPTRLALKYRTETQRIKAEMFVALRTLARALKGVPA